MSDDLFWGTIFFSLLKIIFLSTKNELSDVNKTYTNIGNRQKFELSKFLQAAAREQKFVCKLSWGLCGSSGGCIYPSLIEPPIFVSFECVGRVINSYQ